MASISTFQHFSSIPRHYNCRPLTNSPNHFSISSPFQICNSVANHGKVASMVAARKFRRSRIRFAAEDTQIPEQAAEEAASVEAAASAEDSGEAESTAVDQTVSVPVSPSDKLVMHFQAEGTLNESSVPAVTKALQGHEGVSDLRVQVFEGIASVELTKQTTIQATGVASGLVEVIQGSGFKLQTLNLSFDDEELLVAS